MSRRSRAPTTFSVFTVLLAVLGCGAPAAEVEKARQAEAEASKRLQECEAELARTRKLLQEAQKAAQTRPSPEGGDHADAEAAARWKAARLVAESFIEAVNSRNADAAGAAGTKGFRDDDGGKKAINSFSGGRFRGEANGYTCGPVTRFEAAPGQDEFLGRGGLLYRGVPRQDSSYTVRVVREGDKWHVASFSATER
jgi:hypothetical protein